MRNLKTADIFKMSKILSKMNLKLDVKDKSQEQLGAEMILKIGENLHLAENEVNEFLGDLLGISGEDFSNLPIEESIKAIEGFKNQPGINSFFKLASK